MVLLQGLGTLLAIALLIYLLSQQGWVEILSAMAAIPAWRLAAALGLTFLSRLAVTGRWYVLLSSAGAPITFSQCLKVTFAGLFASHFLPTTVGGDMVRLAGALRFRTGKAVGLASLIVDRLVGMAGMAMAALALSLKLPSLWKMLFAWYPFLPAVGLALQSNDGWVARLRTRIWRAIHRLSAALVLWIKRPDILLIALGFTWIHMLCVFGSIALFLEPLGETMPFWLIGGLWSLTYFVTLLPVSLNGLGVQELSIAFFFTEFGGISATSAITVALLIRVYQMFASLPGALTIPGLLSDGKAIADANPEDAGDSG
jgi:hypothetical protein